MYAKPIATGVAPVAATGAAVLPNTGSNVMIELAIAMAAGLLVWGILYRKSGVQAL